MKSARHPALFAATLLYLAMLSLAISAAQAPVNLTGTWRGTASDFWVNRNVTDGMHVTWTLTQTGSTVSGTVTSTPPNASDGSCSSCHRAKGGTVSGTIAGATLTPTMNFPGNVGGSPQCSVSLNGTAETIATPSFTTLYALEDSCEGPFNNGVLTMTRDSFIDNPLSQGVSVVRALHITELRGRIDTVRGRLSMLPYSYADPTLTAGGTGIRAQHILDLRAALAEAYVAAGRMPPTYTDEGLVGLGRSERRADGQLGDVKREFRVVQSFAQFRRRRRARGEGFDDRGNIDAVGSKDGYGHVSGRGRVDRRQG